MYITKRLIQYSLIGLLLLGACTAKQKKESNFPLVEATIADIHSAMENGEVTAQYLVEGYLKRIEAYDKQGPSINSIIIINPEALATAKFLDSIYAQSGKVGPLHGIPIIIKDNFDFYGMPTSNGTLALKESYPPDDAFQIKKLREAGAIIIAKSNLAEFASSGSFSVSSRLPGYTRNPYDTRRTSAGSSGGTAASIAANLAVVGMGTDTGSSIRGPSSHQALVGIRSTMGLTSRDGIVPLALTNDVGGPMARTVEDVVRVFDVISGYDEADTVTKKSIASKESSYLPFLKADALQGKRIGVLHQLFPENKSDSSVYALMINALEDLKKGGAILIDSVKINDLDSLNESGTRIRQLKRDYNAYLASLGDSSKYKTLQDIIDSDQYHPYLEKRLIDAQSDIDIPENHADWDKNMALRQTLRDRILKVMDSLNLDALIYPSFTYPPRLIGDLNGPRGDTSGKLSPPTGFPAIAVPMGYSYDKYPAGFQLLGRPFSEGLLFSLSYAYEQQTSHRRSPKGFDEL
ncbi:amidase family protein [uncultured Cyclobacterium sp.]|uniref:amidase family protein n=1 Tax=uncultured Cyclobacterium sp. TaxID=453820 RepID=UPI0030EF0CF0|tara:strand:+ start:94057 stop:95616 length:1560 start_codon:yes stop_codon:yes gene_type:complete